MVTPTLHGHWMLNTAIVSRLFLSIRLLERGFIAAAWNLKPVNRIVALAKASLDTWTGSGKMVPMPPESVFHGALASVSAARHFCSSQFLPDPGEFVLAVIASTLLMGSTWIRKFSKRFRVSRHFELFSRSEQKDIEVDLFDENVEITLRIDDPGIDILRTPRCIVTILLPKKDACSSGERIGNASDSEEARLKEHDHKLPFWVK